ncbi:MAG: transposase [Planctomycetaceae bacterium]|nr:transposase [Planctomycetaceae bacterium]
MKNDKIARISQNPFRRKAKLLTEKGDRNHPLTDEQKENNRIKSKIRCRVEHIFGAMKRRVGNETLRTIGRARAKFQIELRNLTYNKRRYASLLKIKIREGQRIKQEEYGKA